MQNDISKILLSETTILKRLDELAAEITAHYRGEDLSVVAILNGSLIFMADLLRRIPLPLRVDCLSVSSYHGTKTTGEVVFRQTQLPEIAGRHVLVLDDILDTGTTLASILQKLAACGALSLRTCVLLRKNVTRSAPVYVDHVGFEISDEFVVGYGLDYMERYRNLPYIGVLTEKAIAKQ